MPEKTNPLTEANREARELIQRAEKFSVRLPVVGTVRVPPPDQLAFYGVLGLLAAVNIIDWPVALAVGAGSAVVARHLNGRGSAAQKQAQRRPPNPPPRRPPNPRPRRPRSPRPRKRPPPGGARSSIPLRRGCERQPVRRACPANAGRVRPAPRYESPT